MIWTILGHKGDWYVVSRGYEPARPGYLGRGVIFAETYKTRREARVAANKENWKEKKKVLTIAAGDDRIFSQ